MTECRSSVTLLNSPVAFGKVFHLLEPFSQNGVMIPHVGLFRGLNEMRWVSVYHRTRLFRAHPRVIADTTVEEALSVDTAPPRTPLPGLGTWVPCDTAGLPARLK